MLHCQLLALEKENPAEAGLVTGLGNRVKLHSTCEVSAKAQIPYRGDFLPLSGKTEKG